jgi:hypothetical protein
MSSKANTERTLSITFIFTNVKKCKCLKEYIVDSHSIKSLISRFKSFIATEQIEYVKPKKQISKKLADLIFLKGRPSKLEKVFENDLQPDEMYSFKEGVFTLK